MADVQDVYSVLGNRIRERRRYLNMTQEQLAASMTLSRAAICNIELGRQRVLLHDVLRFANALRCDLSYFLDDLSKARDWLF